MLSSFIVPMVRQPAAETDERSSLFKISCRVPLSIQALKAHGKFNILLLLMEADKKLHAKIYHIFAVWKDPKVKASSLSLTSVDLFQYLETQRLPME